MFRAKSNGYFFLNFCCQDEKFNVTYLEKIKLCLKKFQKFSAFQPYTNLVEKLVIR